MEEKNFKQRYLEGSIEFEEIDDYCTKWGNSEDPRTLANYLGFNEKEEDVWVTISEEALKEILDQHKNI